MKAVGEIVPLGYEGSCRRVRVYLYRKRTSPRPADHPAALAPLPVPLLFLRYQSSRGQVRRWGIPVR